MTLASQIKYPVPRENVYLPELLYTHPLQNHASIPYKHTELKHNNKPEVNYTIKIKIQSITQKRTVGQHVSTNRTDSGSKSAIRWL